MLQAYNLTIGLVITSALTAQESLTPFSTVPGNAPDFTLPGLPLLVQMWAAWYNGSLQQPAVVYCYLAPQPTLVQPTGPPHYGTSPGLYGLMVLHATHQTLSFAEPRGRSLGRSLTAGVQGGGPRLARSLGAKQ